MIKNLCDPGKPKKKILEKKFSGGHEKNLAEKSCQPCVGERRHDPEKRERHEQEVVARSMRSTHLEERQRDCNLHETRFESIILKDSHPLNDELNSRIFQIFLHIL